jgi:fatty-acyl-CoA synthase
MSEEWSLPAVVDVIAGAVPDREMIVWESVRRTYRDVHDRTRRLAAFLRSHGIGVRTERSELARWECGQDRVAVCLSNCPEYVETMYGAYRARAVPYNVNHHYNEAEIAALFELIGANVVVYHRRLAPLLAAARLDGCLFVDVDDGSGVDPLPGSFEYETAIADATGVDTLPAPSPDDCYLVCTGGTTGRPKGVLWRQGDVYVSAMSGADGATSDAIAGAVTGRPAQVWFAAPPLMHAAGQWTVFSALHNGFTVVLHDDARSFDARRILQTAERERATLLTLVGDAYARPVVEELRAHPYDLSSLQSLAVGGAMTSPELKHALLELLPQVMVLDGYGSSETGGMAFGASTKNAETQAFRGATGAAVLSGDRTRFVEPGDEEIGWTVRTGRVPLGYLGDRDATERTFPIVDGRRLAVPGDRASVVADGTIVLLGRDSLVINSGGEKVFVEEVEEAIRRHPDVLDAVVVGRPSERFGQEVVALVQVRPGSALTGADVRAFAGERISRFKAPRAVRFCDRIGRHPSGKADYRWAKEAAADAVAVTD